MLSLKTVEDHTYFQLKWPKIQSLRVCFDPSLLNHGPFCEPLAIKEQRSAIHTHKTFQKSMTRFGLLRPDLTSTANELHEHEAKHAGTHLRRCTRELGGKPASRFAEEPSGG